VLLVDPGTGDLLRVLAAVSARRRGDVSLSAMARLAHRSPFDLHRRLRRLIGETPKALTARVRLARAAAALVAGDRPVAAIAAEHGFATHEVFTRAFVRRYGVSPRAYRARGLHVDDERTAGVHAATVDAVAPCVGLFHLTIREEHRAMSIDVQVTDLPETHALVMRRRVTRDGIAAALAECIPAAFGYAQREGLAMTGPPFTRYPEVGMGSLVIEAGVPIAAPPPGEPDEGILALTIPAGPAAVTVHRGPYETLLETYQSLEEWVRAKGLTPDGPPREVYVTDPGERPDPATWETQVIQPLRRGAADADPTAPA
jgi:AraC family transcriptional regulator